MNECIIDELENKRHYINEKRANLICRYDKELGEMFGAKNGAIPAENADAVKLQLAVEDQTEGTPKHMVYVIDVVSVRFGGCFPHSLCAFLESFRYMQMLTLNDCAISTLTNFPVLPALIRLDLVYNQIEGESLPYIVHSNHIQTLMLGGNLIGETEHLRCLKAMRNLLQLDLINNPVTLKAGYRTVVFEMFPKLSILDTLDKGGKDAYANQIMVEAVARVPDNLFDKSLPPPPLPLPAMLPAVRKEHNKLTRALARKGSLDSIAAKAVPRGKAAVAGRARAGTSRSNRAGLLFPVARIRRSLKAFMVNQRVGTNSAVYLAAILEYLTAELLEIAGNAARTDGKKRIVPSIMRTCLKGDE